MLPFKALCFYFHAYIQLYCNIALLSAVYRVEASGRDEEYKTLRAIQDRHCITLLPFKAQLTVLKQPAQMRMMEAMVVETNNWGPFKIYNDNWIIANNATNEQP